MEELSVNPEHVKAVKEKYGAFEQFLLQNGQLLTRDTGVGVWGVTNINDIYEAFVRMKLNTHKHMIDLGSGDGRVVLLASLFGVASTGIEYDDWLLNTSLDMKRKLNLPHFGQVTFRKDNFMAIDLSQYDVVYVSPDKPFFRGLNKKLKQELMGKLIVHGYEFHPINFYMENEWVINGEKFSVYRKEHM